MILRPARLQGRAGMIFTSKFPDYETKTLAQALRVSSKNEQRGCGTPVHGLLKIISYRNKTSKSIRTADDDEAHDPYGGV